MCQRCCLMLSLNSPFLPSLSGIKPKCHYSPLFMGFPAHPQSPRRGPPETASSRPAQGSSVPERAPSTQEGLNEHQLKKKNEWKNELCTEILPRGTKITNDDCCGRSGGYPPTSADYLAVGLEMCLHSRHPACLLVTRV